VYESATPGVETADNSTARLGVNNDSQPDALLLIVPERGGQARISDDDYVEDAPELVAEVASSSVSSDLHTKLHVYRGHGVREYVVWRVLDRAVDWFIWREGEYQRLEPDADGLLKSEVFPGLWLDAEALVRGDLFAVVAAVQRGCETSEHRAFVQRLNAKPNG
jgi:Uma2 family endonuclease